MLGRFLAALYPPGYPYYELVLRPEIQYSSELDPAEILAMNQLLMLMEMQVQATLESAGFDDNGNRSPGGFLTQKAKSIRQLIVTGDTLERLDDDFRLRVFRRDQYVTRRDSRGDILFHATKERIDPLSLDEDQFEKTGLQYAEITKLPATERMQDLFTSVEWQPRSKLWSIEQHVNDALVNAQDEKVTPYFATPFSLAPDEHYGRGAVEQHRAALRGLNTLEARRLDILAIMSKVVPCIDHGSPTNEADLTQPSGVPIRTKVREGQVQDVAFLSYGNISEHQSLVHGIDSKERSLAQAFLVESASTRDAERVTAFERRRNALELNAATGGVYPSISDSQQIPMLRRAIHVLRKKKLLPDVPESMYELRSLTGLSAIVRDAKAETLLEFAQVAQALGPEALQRIDPGVLLQVYAQYRSVYEPGLTKSDEQMARERQQAINAEAQVQANQTAIETAGRIAEATVIAGA